MGATDAGAPLPAGLLVGWPGAVELAEPELAEPELAEPELAEPAFADWLPGVAGVGTDVGACPAAGVALAWLSPAELCEPGLVGGPAGTLLGVGSEAGVGTAVGT